MTTVPQRRFWPYDEITIQRDCSHPGRFRISSPWITACVIVDESASPQLEALAWKLTDQNLSSQDIDAVSLFFSSLAQFPISYILPKADSDTGNDRHRLKDDRLLERSPEETLKALFSSSEHREALERILPHFSNRAWKWDASAALEFSAVPQGHDPLTLFSVARRFHLLNSVESDQTEEVFEKVRALKERPETFKTANAWIVRQNHYVTQKCSAALTPALAVAQSAAADLQKFIRAEAGHDALLKRALIALNRDPNQMPAFSSTITLMETFRLIAERNFLAFSMLIDIFERSTYREEDPLSTVLKEGGQEQAARRFDIHRQINDSGAHENIAQGFLEAMASVDPDYATEALRLTELASDLLHLISVDLLEKIERESSTLKLD